MDTDDEQENVSENSDGDTNISDNESELNLSDNDSKSNLADNILKCNFCRKTFLSKFNFNVHIEKRKT